MGPNLALASNCSDEVTDKATFQALEASRVLRFCSLAYRIADTNVGLVWDKAIDLHNPQTCLLHRP